MIRKSQAINCERAMSEVYFARTIAWLLRAQALLSGLVAVAFALGGSVDQAVAALIGGAIGLLLTGITALRVGLSLGRDPYAMMSAFYRAMVFKLILAVILFVIVAKWFSGYFGPVMCGYAATLVAYWLAMWRMSQMPAKSDQSG